MSNEEIEQKYYASLHDKAEVDSNVSWLAPEVEHALNELPEVFRSPILLVDANGFTYEEAAQVLNCPVGTVRSRLFRARKMLYVTLKECARNMELSSKKEFGIMTMKDHFKEELQDLLSDQLDSAKKAAVEEHLKSCSECHQEFESLRLTRQVLVNHLQASKIPSDLQTKIRKALDQKESASKEPAPSWKSLLPYAAVLVLIVFALFYFFTRPADLASQVAKDYHQLKNGSMPLQLQTNDVQRLEQFYTDQGMPFHVTVYDFKMMKYELVGGSIHELKDRKAAVYVYRGENNQFLICEMYFGTLRELPEHAELREHENKRFHIYKRKGLTAVFWPEEKVICVLVSDIDPEEVVQLAFAKAKPGK